MMVHNFQNEMNWMSLCLEIVKMVVDTVIVVSEME